MGILDGLMFWKKSDLNSLDSLSKNQAPLPDPNIGLEPNLGLDSNMGLGNQTGLDPISQPSQFQSFQNPQSPGLADPSRPQSLNSLNKEQQQQPGTTPQNHISKDLEIISSKLDALRSAVESMSQRIANIERMIYDKDQNDRVKQQYRNMPQRPY